LPWPVWKFLEPDSGVAEPAGQDFETSAPGI
jgi:hypothetical protein